MGSGTSNVESKYTVMDDLPFPGLNYYRLVQVDFDGSEEVSKIISLNIDVLDNPFKIERSGNGLILSTRVSEPVMTTVIDMQGRVILNHRLAPDAVFTLGDLNNGIYVIRFYSKERDHTEKIAINR